MNFTICKALLIFKLFKSINKSGYYGGLCIKVLSEKYLFQFIWSKRTAHYFNEIGI